MAMEPVLVPVCIYGFVLCSGGMSTGACLSCSWLQPLTQQMSAE